MTQNNLFEPGKDLPPILDESTDYLNLLVGEKAKFKTTQDLAKGKYESDMYVKTLEQKLDEMRSDYEEARKQNMAGARLEELIDRLNKGSQQSDSDNTNNAKDDENTPNTVKPEDIEKLIESKMTAAKLREKQDANFNTVQVKLRERYGNNFGSVLEQQRQILGLDVEDINALARKSPEAFFRTMRLDQPTQDGFQSPPRSQIRNDNFLPNVQKRTWSWYQDLKKKDRNLYYAPKTIGQMHRDHAELGRDFEDGDYNN